MREQLKEAIEAFGEKLDEAEVVSPASPNSIISDEGNKCYYLSTMYIQGILWCYTE